MLLSLMLTHMGSCRITYRFRYAPSLRPAAAGPTAHFDHNATTPVTDLVHLVSEYQYYEFRTIDRSLTEAETDALRSISSRAEITSTSFTNHYEWGDPKADPIRLLERASGAGWFAPIVCTTPVVD
jgi:hypothetical protein